MGFREEFAWGVATAAYQIEGAVAVDGKGPSIWDMFCTIKGAIWKGQSGDIACDHYHRFPEDIALMKELGVKAYRFSISWPRVIPEGTGGVNTPGLDFYSRLVDALLAAGIDPWITLFHWDFPLALFHRGGWLNAESSHWFANFTRVMAGALGDRVRHWITINEPQCAIGLGHQEGSHAPGLKLDLKDVLRAGHNLLLAHGRGVDAIRECARLPGLVGIAPVGCLAVPAGDSPEDVAAARQDTFSVREKNAWNDTWWMDPVCLGRYPEDGLRLFRGKLPRLGERDLEIIHKPLDFLGINIYQARRIRMGAGGQPEFVERPAGFAHTLFDWTIDPEALYWGPKFYAERYGLPLVITENGMSNLDWVALDGNVHDPQRIDFLQRYLGELRRAATEGVDIRGYFLWTLLDNFEWATGYKQRFGLVYTDFTTQRRIPKDSFDWYKKVIAANGGNL